MSVLTIYSKAACPFCDQAKKFLESKNINYREVRVDQDDEARSFIINEGHRSVPQIYLDGKLFVQGGFQGLKNLSESDFYERLGFKDAIQ